MYKKGQIWGLDLMISVMIFSVALTAFYFYTINERSGSEEKIQTLSYEGQSITNILLSQGYPKDWTTENVVEMGLLTNGKLNKTKLDRFYNFTQTDYPKTKIILNTIYDYYFFIDKPIETGSGEIEGIGKPGTTKNNIDAKNLIKITRVSIYENKPITATLYIWE